MANTFLRIMGRHMGRPLQIVREDPRVLPSLTAFFLLVLLPIVAFAHSATNRFWGEVPVDMLLSGDVLIVKPLVVPQDVTVTIEPGTVVRFEKTRSGDNRIVVRGRLVAAGTAGKPIRFVPKDKSSGPWYGIEFAGGSGRVEHCVFEGATKGVDDPAGKAVLKEVTRK